MLKRISLFVYGSLSYLFFAVFVSRRAESAVWRLLGGRAGEADNDSSPAGRGLVRGHGVQYEDYTRRVDVIL